jgi:putative ABC transport system substrate-binding protein
MIKIVTWLLLIVFLPTVSVDAEAGKVPRIGILPPGPISERVHLWEAFRQGLRELGYIEGQNITLVFPSAEVNPERLPNLAAELVGLNVDVVVGPTTPGARAVINVTRTIPIVAPVIADPVETGLVASLARPGGNITGLATLAPELSGKRLELLKMVVPRVSRIAVLLNPTGATIRPQMRETEVTARALGVQLQRLEVRGPDDFERVFQAATKDRAGALITLDDAFVFLSARGS